MLEDFEKLPLLDLPEALFLFPLPPLNELLDVLLDATAACVLDTDDVRERLRERLLTPREDATCISCVRK